MNGAFTQKQLEYLKYATHRWNIKCGATRSGKTYLDYYVIPKRIRAVAGKDGLNVILGNTKGTLQRNVIEPLQKIWGTQLVSDIKSDNTAYLFGEKVYCLGADKINRVNQIRGPSFKYVYGDEIVTWNREVFAMLKTRLDKSYSKFDGTCNPDSPSHWMKDFIDNSDADIYYQQYSLFDNIFLPKDVKENMLKENVGVYYQRFILGEWALADGLIFSYDEPLNGFDDEEIGGGAWYITCDYGINNPFVAQLWNVKYRRAVCVDEYYYDPKKHSNRRLTDEEHYTAIETLAADKPIEMIVIDPSATSMKETVRRHERFDCVNANNDVRGGIGNMSSFMAQGFLKWSKSKCINTIGEFSVYSWDSDSGEDKPIKNNDHGCDASRYLCQTVLRREWT